KVILTAFKTFLLGILPYLLSIGIAIRDGAKNPLHYICFWFFRSYIFASIFIYFVFIAYGSRPHPATLFFCSTHTMKNIQCSTVIFYFSRGKVNSKHHFTFWNC